MRVAVLFLLAISWACESDSPSASFERRDSAGIGIAESTRPAWESGAGWSLSAAPVLQIGVEEGDSMYQIFRVTAARWLPSGRIAVANSGSNTIRLYDEQGQFLREVGGEGDGPGEFRSIVALEGEGDGPGEFRSIVALERFGGDSLAAYDWRSKRVSLFTGEGDFVRAIRLHQPGVEPIFGAHPLKDGSLVVGTMWGSPVVGRDFATGLHRSQQPVFRYGSTGELLDTVGLFPGLEVYVGRDRSIGYAPFGHITTIDVFDDLVYVGTGDRMEVRAYSPEGDLERIIRGPRLDLTVSQELIAQYREQTLEEISDPNMRARGEARLRELEYPKYRPAYVEILVDASGNLWASRYEAHPRCSSTWTVFDSAARLLGDVNFPDCFRVFDITDRLIVKLWQDQSDVEYVQMYEILK
jgi:hypothetical protein